MNRTSASYVSYLRSASPLCLWVVRNERKSVIGITSRTPHFTADQSRTIRVLGSIYNEVCLLSLHLEAQSSSSPRVSPGCVDNILRMDRFRTCFTAPVSSDQVVAIIFCETTPEQPIRDIRAVLGWCRLLFT